MTKKNFFSKSCFCLKTAPKIAFLQLQISPQDLQKVLQKVWNNKKVYKIGHLTKKSE